MTSQTVEIRQIRTPGSFTVNDGQSLLNAAINGLGIAYWPSFLYASALAEGRVVDVMPELPKETQGIYVVYPPQVNLRNQRCVHLLITWHKPLLAKGQTIGDLLQNHRFDAAVLFTSLWCLIAGQWG
jgi:DNA-binding transcriptional LysR family regulator